MSINKSKLALLGGKKIINKEFKPYNSIGKEELIAVKKVVKSGKLSSFLGAYSKDFHGGKKVQEFEKKWANFFKVKYAISVNSWTSGLIASIGSLDINPGDEIIVSPWTMCATATSILHWNAIPVFADINLDDYCLDPKSVEKNITNKTKAIVTTDIAGHPSKYKELKFLAKKYNLKVISDNAQSIASLYKGKFSGTNVDIGGFSLNYHKHIHTGEGGVVVTNNKKFAERIKLIRNHAEAVIPGIKKAKLNNMIGHNFRLGEIEAAIGLEQLKKLRNIVKQRQIKASFLNKKLKKLKGLIIPKVQKGCTHSYYVYMMRIDRKVIKVSRDVIFQALKAEGLYNIFNKYQNLHLLPLFQKKIAYGNKHFPWSYKYSRKNISYKKGICPNAELLNDKEHLGIEMCKVDLSKNELNLLVKVFYKVWSNLDELEKYQKELKIN
jgi:perosamine synthetase